MLARAVACCTVILTTDPDTDKCGRASMARIVGNTSFPPC
jgi:hypothetical protein